MCVCLCLCLGVCGCVCVALCLPCIILHLKMSLILQGRPGEKGEPGLTVSKITHGFIF